MADERTKGQEEAPTKVGGEAGSGAATQDRGGDAKPAGVGPVDKKEEVEQQPT